MRVWRVIRKILCIVFVAAFIVCSWSSAQGGVAPTGTSGSGSTARKSTGLKISLPFMKPKIELSGGSFREDTENLTVVLAKGETELLDGFTNLQRADFSGSANYEEIAAWAAAHPDVYVVYTVKLPNGEEVNNKTSELTLNEMTAVSLAQTAALFPYLPELSTVELTSVENLTIGDIDFLRESLPNGTVRYSVPLRGQNLSQDTESVNLSGASSEELAAAQQALSLLPKLKVIELGTIGLDTYSREELDQLRQSAPNAELSYTLQVLGQVLGPDTSSLDLSGASQEELAAVIPLLSNLPNLQLIHLGSEANGNITWPNIWDVHNAAPEAALDFGFSIWGVATNLSSTELNLSHVKMDDNGDAVYNVLPLMRNCTVVDMDSCGVDNNSMIRIRDANPNVNVVWRIWFGENYSVRTDVIKILASKPSKGGAITNADVAALSCCTKLKYLDIGHNDSLTDCSFFNSMPDIEVVILTLTGITDITPLANCPHLEYLELTHTGVSDLSPLANAKELRHLNIGDTKITDITALYGLTDMERLFICLRHHVPQDQIDEMQRRAPECEINVDQDDPSLGAWRFANLTDRGWRNWEKTGYFLFDNHPRYELLREQFGYDTEDYAFYWKDPLY